MHKINTALTKFLYNSPYSLPWRPPFFLTGLVIFFLIFSIVLNFFNIFGLISLKFHVILTVFMREIRQNLFFNRIK